MLLSSLLSSDFSSDQFSNARHNALVCITPDKLETIVTNGENGPIVRPDWLNGMMRQNNTLQRNIEQIKTAIATSDGPMLKRILNEQNLDIIKEKSQMETQSKKSKDMQDKNSFFCSTVVADIVVETFLSHPENLSDGASQMRNSLCQVIKSGAVSGRKYGVKLVDLAENVDFSGLLNEMLKSIADLPEAVIVKIFKVGLKKLPIISVEMNSEQQEEMMAWISSITAVPFNYAFLQQAIIHQLNYLEIELALRLMLLSFHKDVISSNLDLETDATFYAAKMDLDWLSALLDAYMRLLQQNKTQKLSSIELLRNLKHVITSEAQICSKFYNSRDQLNGIISLKKALELRKKQNAEDGIIPDYCIDSVHI